MSSESGDSSLLVVGAGVGRTGTSSLKVALEILLKKPCYHLKEIYIHRRAHIKKWLELDKRLRESADNKLDKNLCDEIFKGYVAAVDHPACAYYKELLEVYPNAKVVLTTRDPEIWLVGCRSTILPRSTTEIRPWSFYFTRWLIGLSLLHELFLNSWYRVFGENMEFSNDTAMLNGFVNWNQNVIKTVPKERLLIFDISQGWKPLCDFLNLPIPECKFPHVNEYNELRRLLRLENRIVNFLKWFLPGLIIFAIGYFIFKLLF